MDTNLAMLRNFMEPLTAHALGMETGQDKPHLLSEAYSAEGQWQQVARTHNLHDCTLREIVGECIDTEDMLVSRFRRLQPLKILPPA